MGKTVFISFIGNFWRAHTEEKNIGKPYLLKSTVINAAINYVAKQAKGKYTQIKAQGQSGEYHTYWTLETDKYPQKRSLIKSGKSRFQGAEI